MNVPPGLRQQLLTSHDPLPLLGVGVPGPDGPADADLDRLVARTFTGEVRAARELKRAYWTAALDVATELGVLTVAESERPALESHLHRVPLLATLYAAPAAALEQWALVGLREVLQTPVPYPRRASVDPLALGRFERAMAAAVTDEEGIASRIRLVLEVGSDDVARWTGAVGAPPPETATSAAAAAGSAVPSVMTARRSIEHLGVLADTFATVLRAERVSATFRNSPVPLLGGLTYAEALDAGWEVDVLTDVVRHGGGRRPTTEAGVRYLAGPDAPAVRALAAYEDRARRCRGLRPSPPALRPDPPQVAGMRSARARRRGGSGLTASRISRARVGLTQYVLVPADEPLATAVPDGTWTEYTDFGRWAAPDARARLRVQHCVGDEDVARARARSSAAVAGISTEALVDGPGLLTVALSHDDAADLTTSRSLRAVGLPPTYPSGAFEPGVRQACRTSVDALVRDGETLVRVRPVEPQVRTGQEVLVVVPGTALTVTARRSWQQWA